MGGEYRLFVTDTECYMGALWRYEDFNEVSMPRHVKSAPGGDGNVP